MNNSPQILAKLEALRDRFAVYMQADMAKLYGVYERVLRMASVAEDAELAEAAGDLLKLWDKISDTATVRVLTNGTMDWIRSGRGPTVGVKGGIEQLAGDETLRSNLNDAEYMAMLEVGLRRLEAGGAYDDVRKALATVNELMGMERMERGELLAFILRLLDEAWDGV